MPDLPRPSPHQRAGIQHRAAAIFMLGGVLASAVPAPAAAAEPPTCSARSAATAPIVVELYTSEGCNSCPPADRWLSGLVKRADLVPLAFHVDYWDRLGWADRFASAAHTRRQYGLVASSGGRFAYTPQVIVQGQDWKDWSRLPAPVPSRFDLRLTRSGAKVEASVQPLPGAAGGGLPAQVAAFWAWTEDGHASDVRSGENAGRQLRHDAVVRAVQAVPPWPVGSPQSLSWMPPTAERPGRAVLVITDAQGQRPLQALALRC